MIDNLFLQISIILGVTLAMSFFVRAIKQPLIIAYIVSGLLVGPMFFNLINSQEETYQIFSEFGIVLLLFVVGLSLNFNYLKKVGKVAFVTGVGQVVFTGIFGVLILNYLLNFSLISSVYLAIAITFSSTIIITKLLGDKKDLESVYGRYTIGLMIVQDVIAVLVMIFVGSFGKYSFLDSLSKLLINGLALVFLVFVLSRYVLPKILKKVAESGEFLLVFTLAWCFGLAGLVYWLGFSLEIGAIVAGISLGSSKYQTEIGSRIKPIRDFFIVLFFIILGSQMQLSQLSQAINPGIILSLFIIFGNPFILYLLYRVSKFTRRNSFLAGITAAQVSEFGFILLVVGVNSGHITGSEIPIFTIVALITIFLSSYLITYGEQIYRFLIPVFSIFGKDHLVQVEDEIEKYPVWVFGYHRMGWKICEALNFKKSHFAVVDFNPDIINKLNNRNIPSYYGDAADVEFLETLSLSEAKLIIATLPTADDQKTLIHYIRSINKKAIIVATSYELKYLEDLYEVGANYVMMPHLLGGNWMSDVIKNKSWTENTFKKLRHEQREDMKLRYSMNTHN